jgi:hypothetical protein
VLAECESIGSRHTILTRDRRSRSTSNLILEKPHRIGLTNAPIVDGFPAGEFDGMHFPFIHAGPATVDRGDPGAQ